MAGSDAPREQPPLLRSEVIAAEEEERREEAFVFLYDDRRFTAASVMSSAVCWLVHRRTEVTVKMEEGRKGKEKKFIQNNSGLFVSRCSAHLHSI